MKKLIDTPWKVRRVVYIVTAIIGYLLVTVGVIDTAMAERLTDQTATLLVPLLMGVVSHQAARNTHRGSDSTATDQDVRVHVPNDDLISADKLNEIISTVNGIQRMIQESENNQPITARHALHYEPVYPAPAVGEPS